MRIAPGDSVALSVMGRNTPQSAAVMVKRKGCRHKGGHTGVGLWEHGRHQPVIGNAGLRPASCHVRAGFFIL
jgi:hypothetical protein